MLSGPEAKAGLPHGPLLRADQRTGTMMKKFIAVPLALGAAATLAACGTTSAVTTTETVTAQAAPTPTGQTTPAVTTNAAGQQVSSYTMPASTTPTHCSVWLQGHDAEILFSSTSLDVSPACSSWVQNSAASGELWIANEIADYSNEQVICSLQDASARAEVEDEAGGVYGQEACTRLIAGGWQEQTPSAPPTTTTTAEAPPPPCPTVTPQDYIPAGAMGKCPGVPVGQPCC
jgi:hypothetical protein